MTSQYEVIDQTTKNKLVTGSRGYKDSIILLKHPTYGERIVATLEFSKTNPNLSNLAIDATANATAVNKNSVTGLGQNVFLVVPNRNNWAGIRACPQVVKVKDIVAGCSGEILFRGPNFPQTNGSVTVSASTIDQKEVYGVSGLTGSGVALLEEPVTPLKQKLKAIVSTLFDYVGQSNNTVVVSANYTFNSTSIPSALCAISYSDELLQQHPMTFSSSLYKHSRIFTTDPSTNNFTVSCSHENYTTEISISSLFKNMTENQQTEPKLTLMNPSGQQSSSSLDFDCALVGQGTKEVSLYTNISGIWKKEETKQVTQSPSTVKFHLNDLQNGVYLWNCGAKTASGIVYFSVQNKSFEVKTDVTQSPEPVESESPPNCNPVDDCTEWEPNSCPQNQTQKRTCQNTDVCGYPETNSCIYIVESNSTQQSNITQLPVTTKNKGGFDWLTIILIIVIIVISLVVFIMIKRRSSSVEESEEPYSEEGFGDQGEYGDQGSGTQ